MLTRQGWAFLCNNCTQLLHRNSVAQKTSAPPNQKIVIELTIYFVFSGT